MKRIVSILLFFALCSIAYSQYTPVYICKDTSLKIQQVIEPNTLIYVAQGNKMYVSKVRVGYVNHFSVGWILRDSDRYAEFPTGGVPVISVNGDTLFVNNDTVVVGQSNLWTDYTSYLSPTTATRAIHLRASSDSVPVVLYDYRGRRSAEIRASDSSLFNTFYGNRAGEATTTGIQNVAFGRQALMSNATGVDNCAFGEQALKLNTSGMYNIGVGQAALAGNTTGSENTSIGIDNLQRNGIGSYNVSIGNRAMTNYLGVLQNYNTIVGCDASPGCGSNNVMIGFGAGTATIGNSNVFLGFQSAAGETGSNKLYIENSNADSTQALIYGDFSKDRLRLNGDVITRSVQPSDTTQGVILKSADGSRWRIRVSNTGQITAVKL